MYRKSGIRNINASLSRNWRFGGDKNLTLRAESINFFNTPQFAEPTHDLTSPSFGQINRSEQRVSYCQPVSQTPEDFP